MKARRCATAALIAASIVWVNAALAQDKPAPVPAPSPAPPVVQGSTDVPYPPGANGDAVVLVELTVETDGTVSSAMVTEGVEPFAGQARQAVLAWRFLPARRGGTPIAARIRARVDFHQEQPTAASSTLSPAVQAPPGAAPTAPSPQRAAAAPEIPEEVEVRGARHEIGETTLSATDVREMPGAFGDPFRAIEALPGGGARREWSTVLLHPRSSAERQRVLRGRHPRSAAFSRGHR